MRVRTREYKDKHNAHCKEHMKNHPYTREQKDRRNERTKDWRKRNPEKNKLAILDWYRRHPERVRELSRLKMRRLRTTNFHDILFFMVKSRARKRHMEFDLSIKWIISKLEKGVCERTGIPFSMPTSVELRSRNLPRRDPFRPSIDRINPKLGYTKRNCQMVCCIYNIAKNDWDDKTVFQMAAAIVKQSKRRK